MDWTSFFCSRSFAVLKGSKNGQTYIVEEQNYTCVVPKPWKFMHWCWKSIKAWANQIQLPKNKVRAHHCFFTTRHCLTQKKGNHKKVQRKYVCMWGFSKFFQFCPIIMKTNFMFLHFWRNIDFFLISGCGWSRAFWQSMYRNLFIMLSAVNREDLSNKRSRDQQWIHRKRGDLVEQSNLLTEYGVEAKLFWAVVNKLSPLISCRTSAADQLVHPN